MNFKTTIDPEKVFRSLFSKPGRAGRRRALVAVHDACKSLHGANRQISVSTVGRLCEEQGIFRARALYNKQSADSRALIDAWAIFAASGGKEGANTSESEGHQPNVQDILKVEPMVARAEQGLPETLR